MSNDNLMLDRIRLEDSIENLIVLFVDSYRRDDQQTNFHNTNTGGLGLRDSYTRVFLVRHRRLIERLLKAKFNELLDSSQWEALYRFHTTFPSSHFISPPGAQLQDLRRLIENECHRRFPVNGQPVWEIVQSQVQRLQQMAIAHGNIQQSLPSAIAIVRRKIQVCTGQGVLDLCHESNTALRTGGGMSGLDRTHWAEAIARLVTTLNRLRTSRGVTGGIISGVRISHTLENSVKTAAINIWNHTLNDNQRTALRNNWQGTTINQIWEMAFERIEWGLDIIDSHIGGSSAQVRRDFRRPGPLQTLDF